MRTGDRIGGSVILNDVDVSAKVESFRARFGWDMRVSEVDVVFALTPDFADYGSLVIRAGLTSKDGDTFGPGTQRFNGLAVGQSVQHWPYAPGIAGRGWLHLAEQLVVPNDYWGDGLLVPPSVRDALPAQYLPPGVDMSNGALGATDWAQVVSILSYAGITTRIEDYPADIGGFAALLGTQVRSLEQFVWTRGQSGLSYIESLDEIMGYRTFDTPYGWIRRESVSNLVPTFSSVAYTLNENTDILAGGSITRDYGMVRNRVNVAGWDPGGGGNVYSAIGAALPLPPGQATVTEYRSSPLIEKTLAADVGEGLSCEQVANFWLAELQYPMFEISNLPTWRDDPFKPGDVIYINCPHLLGVNQAMTLKHVEVEVTASTFTQYLTLRAQDYAIYRGPTGLPLGGTPGGPTDPSGAPLGPTPPTGPTGGPMYFPWSLPMDLG